MAKYRIPMQIISYTEVEANNLLDAVSKASNDNPDIEGVNLDCVDSWIVSEYDSIYKDGEEICGEETDDFIYLSNLSCEQLEKY